MILHFVIRIAINAVALVVTTQIIPGISLARDDLTTILVVALIFAVVNALLKPLITLLTCPLVILTLGLFTLVINGLMLLLTAYFSDGRLTVDGWIPAILGGIVMAVVGMIMEVIVTSLTSSGSRPEQL